MRHKDGPKSCEFQERDTKGHWHCRLLEFSGQPVILITPNGRVEWATASAHHLLHRYWPQRHALETLLPVEIRKWMIRSGKKTDSRERSAQETPPLVINRPTSRLVVRTIHDGTFSALLFEEHLFELPTERLITLGLTDREAEVLRWLAQGKTSSEIGTILRISPKTVSKHLTRVYQRLGVENRHAAMAMALEAIRPSSNTFAQSQGNIS